MMFDDLITKNNIDLPENDIRFIKALIAGDPTVAVRFRGCYAFYVCFINIFQGQQPPGETVFV
jgi:hypothetical protein